MLTIIGFIISILIVVTQVAARQGRVDPDLAFSIPARIFFTFTVLGAILTLSFSHVAYVSESANWSVIIELPYTTEGNYWDIEGVSASRISIFLLSVSFLSLIPLVHHVYQRAHPRKLFYLLGQSLVSSRSQQKLSQRFKRIRRHLLSFASSDELSSFESGLTALEESVRKILAGSKNRMDSHVADELGKTLRSLTETVRDDDVLLKRLVRHQVRISKVFANKSPHQSSYFIKKVRVIMGKNLIWWYDGELSHTAGIRSMSAVVDLAEICTDHRLVISFANESKSLSKCVGQMTSIKSGRALTACFSGITKLADLSIDHPFLNVESILEYYSRSIKYLADSEERPSIPEYRIREGARPILYILSSDTNHDIGDDACVSVASLKEHEFKALIDEMYTMARN